MIFADKLIELRKKCGWTQEELAEKLEVTRQAVSKWEGAQSIPDLDKILQLSRIFGVTTDYLLRDELEETETIPDQPEASTVRRVSMEEASNFLRVTEQIAKPYTLAVFLCIFSPIPLLMFASVIDGRTLPERVENFAGGLGMILLLLFIAAAVAIFIWCGGKTSRYDFLETENFETEYGVTGMVRARQEQFRSRYVRGNIIGTVLCVLSPIPLFCGSFLSEKSIVLTSLLCCLLLMAGIGVVFFVLGGTYWEAMEKLLQEGDHSRDNKHLSHATRYIAPIYWLVVVAAYVGWGLAIGNWDVNWIIWPVAALLFVPVRLIARAIAEWRLGKNRKV